jgi:hypothetical protein
MSISSVDDDFDERMELQMAKIKSEYTVTEDKLNKQEFKLDTETKKVMKDFKMQEAQMKKAGDREGL